MRATAGNWIEKEISTNTFEPFLILNSRRYQFHDNENSLLPPIPGILSVYKLGSNTKANQLPDWLRVSMPRNIRQKSLQNLLSDALRKKIAIWTSKKPWLCSTEIRKKDIKRNLDAIGDWSFRLSRNESLHPYPSTFVYAIPSCIINSLGLRGDLILDPFGGTGQTATEVIKSGGYAISADINSISTLVAKSKFTYLSAKNRAWLRSLNPQMLLDYPIGEIPAFEFIEKWHHPSTLDELCRIRSFIYSQQDVSISLFLKAAFSAILAQCTARRGKQHGFFADNTPLARKEKRPPYQNAVQLFLDKIENNLCIIEKFYSYIERAGRNPEQEIARASIIKADITAAKSIDYGTNESAVAGIITSPPYLCMSDYSLGQRLSYYWLFPECLKNDYDKEMGARRKRTSAESAAKNYFSDFEKFRDLSFNLLRPGGFLAMVLGAPVAKSFVDIEIHNRVDTILKEKGFKLLWSIWRPIYWHRNHGYARLKEERISIHIIEK
ncbi:MAG: DNA methyltransferase [Candidatus Sumerlaeota bacterium]|nr:DNA methyltransferase [Candidatus Sumerlaeota bacterium]